MLVVELVVAGPATAVVRRPKPVASASRASATIEADRTVRNTVVQLIASFQISDRVPSKLQCSVARMVAPSGPNGRSVDALVAAIAMLSLVPVACLGVLAFPVLSGASIAGGIARANLRVAVSGRWEQEPSFFTVVVWRDQAEHAAESLPRAAGSWL